MADFGDVLAHFWRCGVSLFGDAMAEFGDVLAHFWRCGISLEKRGGLLVRMLWLIREM